MKREEFVYNKSTLRYEKVIEPLKIKIFRVLGFICGVIVSSIIIISLAYYHFPSPKEEALMREIAQLKSQNSTINNDIEQNQEDIKNKNGTIEKSALKNHNSTKEYLIVGLYIFIITLVFIALYNYRRVLSFFIDKFRLNTKGAFAPFFSMEFDMPEEFKTSIQQYILFFKEYVKVAKGKEIMFKVSPTNDGLRINFKGIKTSWDKEIKVWFQEYMDLIRSNIEEMSINVENNIPEQKLDILIIKLKNEISHLRDSLQIALLENKYLNEKYIDIKELAFSLANRNFIVNNQYIQGGDQPFNDIVKENFAIQNNKIKNINNCNERIIKEISKGNIENAFDAIAMEKLSNKISNSIVLLKSQYYSTEEKYLNGLFSTQELIHEVNRITLALIKIINKIEN